MLDYPVLRTVIARKIIHGDEASRNEGEMMEAELDGILSALRAAQQSVQPTVLCAGHSEGSFFKDGVCQTCGLPSPHSG